MKTHADRTRQSHDRSVAHVSGPCRLQLSASRFEDNRLQARTHGALQKVASNSPHARRFRFEEGGATQRPLPPTSTVQRKIKIGADKDHLKTIEDWGDVEKFLTGHGHHSRAYPKEVMPRNS
jgi:hypothetical protein